METKIDTAKVRAAAEAYYAEGGLLCSEAVARAICAEHPTVSAETATALASGFPGGLGSGCTCGALSGGVMSLGLFLGRQAGFADNSAVMRASSTLHNRFKEVNGSTCCRVLTRNFDKSKGEHKPQCIRLTGDVAQWVAETINSVGK